MIAIPLFLRVGAFGALFSSVAIFSSGGVDKFNLKIQRTIMRIVRDMSRHKARKKMDAEQQYGLVPFLLFSGGDISNSQVLDDLLQNFDTFDIISREELSLAKGGQIEESSCIDNKNVSSTCDSSLQSDLWISILGHVFDVKAGAKFYGEGGSYEMLAGRDATKALASGDLTVATDEYEEDYYDYQKYLDKAEIDEARRWLEYFALHHKYKHVGRLPHALDSLVDIDAIVNKEMSNVDNNDTSDVDDDIEEDEDYYYEEENKPPEWHPEVLDNNAMCPGGGNK